eukprot:2631653-Rhodomonas_salina.1
MALYWMNLRLPNCGVLKSTASSYDRNCKQVRSALGHLAYASASARDAGPCVHPVRSRDRGPLASSSSSTSSNGADRGSPDFETSTRSSRVATSATLQYRNS